MQQVDRAAQQCQQILAEQDGHPFLRCVITEAGRHVIRGRQALMRATLRLAQIAGMFPRLGALMIFGLIEEEAVWRFRTM